MNRNKTANLREGPSSSSMKNSLSPATYKVNEIDDRIRLSTKLRPIAYAIPKKSENKNSYQSMRFIDIHKKHKDWVPGVSKYNYTGEQMRKNTSSSPLKPRYKR
jgi:hypothetical protein